MIFKQNVLKEEIIKFLIGVIGVLTIYIPIIIIGLITEENPILLLFVLSILYRSICKKTQADKACVFIV